MTLHAFGLLLMAIGYSLLLLAAAFMASTRLGHSNPSALLAGDRVAARHRERHPARLDTQPGWFDAPDPATDAAPVDVWSKSR